MLRWPIVMKKLLAAMSKISVLVEPQGVEPCRLAESFTHLYCPRLRACYRAAPGMSYLASPELSDCPARVVGPAVGASEGTPYQMLLGIPSQGVAVDAQDGCGLPLAVACGVGHLWFIRCHCRLGALPWHRWPGRVNTARCLPVHRCCRSSSTTRPRYLRPRRN